MALLAWVLADHTDDTPSCSGSGCEQAELARSSMLRGTSARPISSSGSSVSAGGGRAAAGAHHRQFQTELGGRASRRRGGKIWRMRAGTASTWRLTRPAIFSLPMCHVLLAPLSSPPHNTSPESNNTRVRAWKRVSCTISVNCSSHSGLSVRDLTDVRNLLSSRTHSLPQKEGARPQPDPRQAWLQP